MDLIQDKLKLLPENPGVYIMYDEFGQVIYVGKAKNLKNRVRQYFFSSAKPEKVTAMVSRVKDFNYIITDSEVDALSLENNLIKKHKPKYNILLKDDKTYPYLKIDLKEEFPCVKITRKILKDGAKYFGPFMGGINAGEIKNLVDITYKLRPCTSPISCKKIKKECLNYHIGKCLSPCSGKINREDYVKRVKLAVDFLSGGDDELPKQILTEEMQRHAENEQFESALCCRDRLKSLEKLKLKRVTSLNKNLNADIIGISTNKIFTAISLFFVRNGRMLGHKYFEEESLFDTIDGTISEFISRYYAKADDIPSEVIVQSELVDESVLSQYLSKKAQKSISIVCPKTGAKKQLLDMALLNADDYLEKAVTKVAHKSEMTAIACQKLKTVLNLNKYPKRMECFDISHISGVDKVGSMVVFIDGKKDASEYRRFKIKTVEGNNDFASLKEVLTRRLLKLGTIEEDKFPKPDLIIIDGGKGQLSSVKEVFDELNITDIDLISLAEREEEVFTLTSKNPVLMDKSDYALRLLQRIRDEAHRFAITFNRSLRSKRSLTSALDNIKGIGREKKKALIEKFKDLSGIISSTKDDFLSIKGIGEKQADEIILELKKQGLIKN